MSMKDTLKELLAATLIGMEGGHSKLVQEFKSMQSELEAANQECEDLSKTLREVENQRQKDAQLIIDLQNQLKHTKAKLAQVKAGGQSPAITNEDFIALCKSADGTKIEEAIINGGDVNAKDKSGFTALIWAAKEGRDNVVELLLKYNADINARNNKGVTALMWASSRGNTKTTKVLLDHSAEVDIKDNKGWTALRWAKSKSSKEHTEIADLLRRYGARD